MDQLKNTATVTHLQWWRQQSKQYNYGLLLGAAFMLLICGIIYMLTWNQVPLTGSEIVQSAILLLFGYLLYVLFANVFYLVAPYTEVLVNPQKSFKIRQNLFDFIVWTAALLPGVAVLCSGSFSLH